MLELLRKSKDPQVRLDAARRLREAAEALESDVVSEARRAGMTWTAIGELYGMSKQAAQQRFRRSSQ